jgi:hypothetical protein
MTPLHSILFMGYHSGGASWIDASLNSFRAAHPGAILQLYCDESLRHFIADCFDCDVVAAYDRFDNAGKSHLGRYCLLYEQGGVYSDPTVFFVASAAPSPDGATLRAFRNVGGAARGVSTAIIAAPAKMALFEDCIKSAVDVPAPGAKAASGLFASAIATRGEKLSILWGDEIHLPSRTGVDRRAYKSAAGNFVAVGQTRNAAGAHALAYEEDAMALLAMLDGWL